MIGGCDLQWLRAANKTAADIVSAKPYAAKPGRAFTLTAKCGNFTFAKDFYMCDKSTLPESFDGDAEREACQAVIPAVAAFANLSGEQMRMASSLAFLLSSSGGEASNDEILMFCKWASNVQRDAALLHLALTRLVDSRVFEGRVLLRPICTKFHDLSDELSKHGEPSESQVTAMRMLTGAVKGTVVL